LTFTQKVATNLQEPVVCSAHFERIKIRDHMSQLTLKSVVEYYMSAKARTWRIRLHEFYFTQF